MSDVKLTLLGTKGGPRVGKGTSWPTSSVLEVNGQPYVIDAGLGVTRQYVEAGFDLAKLKTVLITHHHSDHNLELGGLLHTTWCSVKMSPIKVYGPNGLNALMEGFFASQKFDIDLRTDDEGATHLSKLVDWQEYSEGLVFEDDRVAVSALRVEHPPVHYTYALKFETDDKTVVFGADTRFHPPLADFARGADILVHEVMHSVGAKELCDRSKEVKPKLWDHFTASHTPCEQVGELATMAGVKHVVLNHYVPDPSAEYPREEFVKQVGTTFNGKISAGHDLMVVEA